MKSSSNDWSYAGTSAQWVVALAATLLPIACAGPSPQSDHISTATEALDAPTSAVLSAEFDLDHPVVLERPTNCPQVAFGTNSYLVTHTDPDQPLSLSTWGPLAASRVDRNGNIVEVIDIPGAFVGSSNGCAPVVFAGGAFVTLWPAEDGTLWCTRIAEDGTLLNGRGVSTGLPSIEIDSATLDGTKNQMLVAMTNGQVAIVGADCLAHTGLIPLPATTGATRWTSGATFDGSQYLVAYSEKLNGVADRFLLQAVSTTGSPSGMPITIATAPWVRTANSQIYLPAARGSVAVGGGKTAVGYTLALKDDRFQFPNIESHYAELSSSGELVNDMSLGVGNFVSTIKIGFASGQFFLAQPNVLTLIANDGTTMRRTFGRGQFMDPITISFDRDGSNLLFAMAGWTQTAPSSLIHFFGTALYTAPQDIQHMSERHQSPVVASGAQSSLVVWLAPDFSFMGSRISTDGAILDDTALNIHPYSAIEQATPPIVAASETNFLVGWSEISAGAGQTARVNAVVVSSNGEIGSSFIVSQASFPGDPHSFKPAVASDGSDYLMVWDHDGALEAARVTHDGRQVLDRPPLILQTGSNYREVAVTYDGDQYVVVSRVAPQFDFPPTAPFVVQRVSRTGEVTAPVATPWQASVSTIDNLPKIAWGADQGLVAFAQGEKLFVGRLSATLEPLDDPGILVTEHLNGSAIYVNNGTATISVAWDGTNYWVSWKDSRRAESDDIYVARVSPSGALLDPNGVPLSLSVADPPRVGWPGGAFGGLANCTLASGQGRALAAYTRFDSASDVFNFVQHGRWLSSESVTGGTGGAGGAGGASSVIGGACGTTGGDVGTSGGASSTSGGTSSTSGGASSTSGGTSSTSGPEFGTGGGSIGAGGTNGGASGGDVGTNGGASSAKGGDVGMNGGDVGTNGGVAGTGGSPIGASAGTGGLGGENTGEAGSAGSGSPSDEGGTSGSAATNGGNATGGATTPAAGSTSASSGATCSPDSHSSHDSGCSVGTHTQNAKLSLLWLAALSLPLLRRARRPKRAAPSPHSV